ncbi:head decoration protein [bacterium endosymbiont of Escarpia laminata]|nr:MAG: head decoration protein [bacterium endosymbiont of Escarpia laminata]
MANLTEGIYPAEFIISESRGTRSRDAAVLATGNNLDAGTVLGKITASGKYAEHDPAAVDGTENAVAILYAPTDATLADASCVVVSRDAEVDGNDLVWITGIIAGDKTDGIASLAGVGIIVR